MEWLNWLSLLISIVGLFLGYLGAKGELEKRHRNRKLPKLLNDLEFYKNMQNAHTTQITYLLETLVIVSAIIGGAVFLYATAMPQSKDYPANTNLFLWLSGGTIYLFSIYRFGRYWRSTTKFQKTIAELNNEIEKFQANK